jgi:site-specific DNA-methyltransferase (adenine-specific)
MGRKIRIYEGDCLEVTAGLADDSVDAVVTDPPYGLEFMGKAWDKFGGSQRGKPGIGDRPTEWVSNQGWNGFRCRGCGHLPHGGSPCQCDSPDFARADNRLVMYQEWCRQWAVECLRVLKPGGYMLAFGGTRTYHRLTCAIEDAGFEIRDSIHWIYGTGFPKSLDVGKAIDKAAGAEREVVGRKAGRAATPIRDIRSGGYIDNRPNTFDASAVTAPATEDAARWEGWGTALKPAHEPIVLARKPLAGTVAGNVLAHGTGALNVQGCRVGITKNIPASPRRAPQGPAYSDLGNDPATGSGWDKNVGRWPPNILLGEAAAREMDAQTGDTGGASRFFPVFRYQAKAPKKERPTIEGLPSHPTVKPLALMRWLVRLVTPPAGLILDPFAGTGTTGEAALAEGLRAVLIERDPGYVQLIRARLDIGPADH